MLKKLFGIFVSAVMLFGVAADLGCLIVTAEADELILMETTSEAVIDEMNTAIVDRSEINQFEMSARVEPSASTIYTRTPYTTGVNATPYSYLNISIHSGGEAGQVFGMAFYDMSKKQFQYKGNEEGYKIDWTDEPGQWRIITVPLSDFKAGSAQSDWTKIRNIRFNFTERGGSLKDGAILNIDRVWLSKSLPSGEEYPVKRAEYIGHEPFDYASEAALTSGEGITLTNASGAAVSMENSQTVLTHTGESKEGTATLSKQLTLEPGTQASGVQMGSFQLTQTGGGAISTKVGPADSVNALFTLNWAADGEITVTHGGGGDTYREASQNTNGTFLVEYRADLERNQVSVWITDPENPDARTLVSDAQPFAGAAADCTRVDFTLLPGAEGSGVKIDDARLANEDDYYALTEAEKITLESVLNGNRSKNEVKNDLYFQTECENATAIRWSTSRPDTISSDGTVTLGDAPVKAEVMCRVIRNGIYAVSRYLLTVTDQVLTDADQVAIAKAELDYDSLLYDGQNADALLNDLKTPPTRIDEVTVNWISSAPEVISPEGVVTISSVTKIVTLTAELTLGDAYDTKEFTFTVLAEQPDAVLMELGTESGIQNAEKTTVDYNESFLYKMSAKVIPSDTITYFQNRSYFPAVDMNKYQYLNFWVHSAGLPGQRIGFRLYDVYGNDFLYRGGASKSGYLIDWTDEPGEWHLVSIPLSEFTTSKAGADWSKIVRLRVPLKSNGGNLVNGSVLNFEKFWVSAAKPDEAVLKGEVALRDTKARLEEEFNGISVSSGIGLPARIGDISIAWKSSDPSVLADDGSLVQRPAASRGNVMVTMTGKMTHDAGPEESISVTVTVYNESLVPARNVQWQENALTMQFDLSESNLFGNAAYALLQLPKEYFEIGGVYSIADAAGQGLMELTVKGEAVLETIDLTTAGAVPADGKLTLTVRPKEDARLLQSGKEPYIRLVPESGRKAYEAIAGLDLGDLSQVTDNLNLPKKAGDVEIQWSSDNPEVLTMNGRVIRPAKDTTVTLHALARSGDYVYEYDFFVTVLKDGELLRDPQHTSDEEFFGVWDEHTGDWKTKPILQYQGNKDLDQVLSNVKGNDYDEAKESLLAYYRKRDVSKAFPVNEAGGFSVAADAAVNKIFSFRQMDDFLGIMYLTPELQYQTIDLTSASVQKTYMLFDADMDGSDGVIYSKENPEEKPPVLEVIADGVRRTYEASADTYISAGDNIGKNYGNSELLYCREAAGGENMPFGSDTKRTYIQFDTSDLTGNEKITSVQLKLYAKSGKETENKKIYILKTANENSFSEKSLNWLGHYPQVFNFKETGYIWKTASFHQGQWGTEFEWLNYCTRMYQVELLATQYLRTKEERFAHEALEMILSMYTQQEAADYPRVLEGGWRTQYLMQCFFGLLSSDSMTGETATALLKYMYTHANMLRNNGLGLTGNANQASAVRIGFTRICAYVPEISQEGWWNDAKGFLKDLYNGVLLNPDGSYTEATSGYVETTIIEMMELLRLVGNIEDESSADYQYFLKQYDTLCMYYVNFAMNYGKTPAYGDGQRMNIKDFAKRANAFRPNQFFEYFATDGASGKAPDYTSILYPDKPIAFLRSDWLPNGFSAVINADGGGGHSHYDDLSLDVYAYGSPLLVDAGTGSYSPGSLDAETRTKAISHNTIDIDGMDQVKSNAGIPQRMTLKTNKLFDFVDAGGGIYKNFDLTRKVLFLKNSCWIVSDVIDAPENEIHSYKQAWHPDENNNLVIDPDTKSIRTNFANGANITVIPADPDSLDAVQDQTYMVSNGTVPSMQDYARYEKNYVVGDQTFDTVLYPDNVGEETIVGVERLPMDVDKTVATALSIDYGGKKTGAYYSYNERYDKAKAETASPRSFGDYAYLGEMAYIEKNQSNQLSMICLTNGSILKEGERTLVTAEHAWKDLGIEYGYGKAGLYTSEGLPAGGVRFGTDRAISTVTLNGIEVEFELRDGLIWTDGTPKKDDGGKDSIPVGGGGGGGGGGKPPVVVPPTTPTPTPTPTTPPTDDSFSDTKGHWAEADIAAMVEKGVVSGMGDGTFQPERNVTRAEFISMVVKTLELPLESPSGSVFDDVNADAWYAAAVETAYAEGLVNGRGDEGFQPDGEITRQEMAKIVMSAYERMGNALADTADTAPFADEGDIADWAKQAVLQAAALSLINGTDGGAFQPASPATRAQAVAVLHRLTEV